MPAHELRVGCPDRINIERIFVRNINGDRAIGNQAGDFRQVAGRVGVPHTRDVYSSECCLWPGHECTYGFSGQA